MDISSPNRVGFKAILQPKVVITLGFTLAFYFLVKGFEGVKIPDYPYGGLMPQTALILTSLLAMGAMFLWAGRTWSYYLLVHLLAFGFGAATLVSWSMYDYAAGAVNWDAWFSTAITVKYKAHWSSTDFGYKGLHSFYPSLYQYVVAKLGVFSGTTAIKAMKYGMYWTAYLLPIAAYGLWRKLLSELPAFLMVLFAMAISRGNLTFKPFEVIALNVFVPWAIYYVAGLRRRLVDGEPTWEVATLGRREIFIGGLIGGLCFMTYYYYFFLLVVWVPMQALVAARTGTWRRLRQHWTAFGLMVGVMMLVSAIYWVPLVLDMLRFGMASYQNRWFAHHMFTLPIDISNQWKGLLGLVLLLVLAPRNQLARAALVMLIAVIAFILLGHVGMYCNFPLLHFRIVGLDEYLLYLGLALGVHHYYRRITAMVEAPWDKLLPVALMGVYFIGMGMNFMWEKGRDISTEAAKTKQPTLIDVPAFTEFSREKVFLTNQKELAAYRPLYLFIVPNAHYSHPASRYRERLKFLVLLSKSKDSDFVSWMLQHNRYDKVDFVSLEHNRLELSDDNFPEIVPHIGVEIKFPKDIFKGRYFQQDTGFAEIIHVMPMPADDWKRFTPEQQRLVALFSDVDRDEVRSQIPAPLMATLEDELHCRTKDYVAWQRVFWFRHLGGW